MRSSTHMTGHMKRLSTPFYGRGSPQNPIKKRYEADCHREYFAESTSARVVLARPARLRTGQTRLQSSMRDRRRFRSTARRRGSGGALMLKGSAASRHGSSPRRARRRDERLHLLDGDLGSIDGTVGEGPEAAVRIQEQPVRRVEL